MAKIGNESRLILKLAQERIKSSPRLNIKLRSCHEDKSCLEKGYNIGVSAYQDILYEIVAEIERK